MTQRLSPLSYLVISLAAALVLEAIFLPGDPAGRQASHSPIGHQGTASLPDRSSNWAAISLKRPLFAPDRRAPPTQDDVDMSPGVPRLSGIVFSPEMRLAIFNGSNGKPLTLGENGQIGAYRILSIATDHVTVMGPDGTRVLHPRFGPQAARSVSAGQPVFKLLPPQATAHSPNPSPSDLLSPALPGTAP